MNAFEIKPKIEYLVKAKEIIGIWITANPSPEKQASQFAWKDHSSGNRVVNIIFFWFHYKESIIFEPEFNSMIMSSLQKHGSFLEDDNNYSFGNNLFLK